MSLPRTRCISRSDKRGEITPHEADGTADDLAAGLGNNRMIASAVNDLPQPDSPTMAKSRRPRLGQR